MSTFTIASRISVVAAGGAALLSIGLVGPAHAATGNGANQPCGAYCANNVGAPSGNGKATNQPAAGTKGKADNKFPPGQSPNGTDHNKGYECDGNQGVGQTNPAHTGCTRSTPPPS